jgi:hypothetical protein
MTGSGTLISGETSMSRFDYHRNHENQDNNFEKTPTVRSLWVMNPKVKTGVKPPIPNTIPTE